MSQEDINVRVTATADPAKLAFRDVSAEMAKMSQTLNTGSENVRKLDDNLASLLTRIDPVYRAQKQLSEATDLLDRNLKAGNISAAQHAGFLQKVESAYTAATTSGHSLSFATAGATRELIVLGHEAVSGNFSRMPGSFMVLLERMGGLTIGTLGWVAAIAGAGYATYEWIAHNEKLAASLADVKVAMEATGQGARFNAAAVEEQIHTLDRMPGVSHDMAQEITVAFARAGRISDDLKEKLIGLVADYAAATGEEAPRAAKALIEAFTNVDSGAKKLNETFTGMLSPSQKDSIDNFLRLGDTMHAQEALFEALKGRINGLSEEALTPMEKRVRALTAAWESLKQVIGAVQEGFKDSSFGAAKAGLPASNPSPRPQYAPSKSAPEGFLSDDAVSGAFRTQAEEVEKRNEAMNKGLDLEQRMGLFTARKAELEGKITQLKQAQAAATTSGDQQLAGRFQADIVEAQQQLESLHDKGTKTRNEALRNELAALDTQMAAARKGSQERIDLAEQEVALVARTEGMKSAKYQEALRKLQDARREAFDQARELDRLEEEAARQHAAAMFEIQAEDLSFRRQMGQITASEELAGLQDLKRQEYESQLQALQQEKALAADKPIEQERINNRMLALQEKFNLDMQKLQHRQTLEVKHTWDDALRPVSSAFDGALRGMVNGTLTWRRAIQGATRSIVADFASMGLKMVENWAASKLSMMAWTQIFGDAEAATTAETAAANAATTAVMGIATIQTHAAEAGAAAYASTAAIPIIGPELAPEAAAMAYAGAMSFAAGVAIPSAAGGWEVPRDTLAMVHEQEMILPAELSNRIRNMTDSGGGGDVHLHVHALDASSVKKLFMSNGAAIASALSKQARNFNPHAASWKA